LEQPNLGLALQEVEETKQALATIEVKRDMIRAQQELAIIVLNATHMVLIRVKVNSAPISTFQTTSCKNMFNMQMTG